MPYSIVELRKPDLFDALVKALGVLRGSIPSGAKAGLSMVVVPTVDLIRFVTYPLGKSGNVAVTGGTDTNFLIDGPTDEQWEVESVEIGPVNGALGTWETYALGVGLVSVAIKLEEYTATAGRVVWKPARPVLLEGGSSLQVWMVPGASPVNGNVPYKVFGRRIAFSGVARGV